MDIFLDCLSLKPHDIWKDELLKEINSRDIFYLFWSRHASSSEWVDWEWRTALSNKGLRGIQPHPLESADVAPPPAELSDLQFGTLFEEYLSNYKNRKLSILLYHISQYKLWYILVIAFILGLSLAIFYLR